MTWEIFLGLVSIIGFVITVCGPLMKLNTNIVKLNDSLEVIQKALDKLDEDNEKSHTRIWEHNQTQDKLIKDHDERIDRLEKDWQVACALNPKLLQRID